MSKTIIETERFIMRKFILDDAEAMYLLNLDPEVMKYTGDKTFASVEESLTFLQNYNPYDTEGFGRWVCVLKETGEITGWCGLRMQPDIGLVDLGYRFYKRHWGKGYATETSLASLEHGFIDHNLPVIIARAMNENLASIRVMQKCGMEYWKETTCGHEEEPAVYYRIFNPYTK